MGDEYAQSEMSKQDDWTAFSNLFGSALGGGLGAGLGGLGGIFVAGATLAQQQSREAQQQFQTQAELMNAQFGARGGITNLPGQAIRIDSGSWRWSGPSMQIGQLTCTDGDIVLDVGPTKSRSDTRDILDWCCVLADVSWLWAALGLGLYWLAR